VVGARTRAVPRDAAVDRGRDELATPVVDPIACRTMRHAIAGFAASTSIH